MARPFACFTRLHPPFHPLQPVRDHFESNAEAKALLKAVKSYKTTR